MSESEAPFVRSRRLAWAMFGATVIVSLLALLFMVLARSFRPLLGEAASLLVPVGYALLGALIATRQPRNAIGWLYLGVGLGLGVTAELATSYAVYALLVNPGTLPAADAALWLGSPAFDSLFFLMFALLLLLFPDGHPLAPRWRAAVWATAIGGVLGIAQAFQDYTIDPPLQAFHNPYLATGRVADVLDVIGGLAPIPLLGGIVAGFVSAILRYRRARGVERQQLRWFAAGIVAIVATILASIAIYATTGHTYDTALFLAVVCVVPATTGVAILRYRLYEIDVLIRRTLVYTCLIAGLGALYLLGVVGLGALFRLATGQSGALAVTGSTLAVAAAFQPLRRRIQRTVDHRFYRARYDAVRALDTFGGRLRQEIDLETLRGEVLDVVNRTVQPHTATLWLRSAP